MKVRREMEGWRRLWHCRVHSVERVGQKMETDLPVNCAFQAALARDSPYSYWLVFGVASRALVAGRGTWCVVYDLLVRGSRWKEGIVAYQ